VIDLAVNDVGLAIGDKPHVTGLRIKFRDHDLRQVNGANITLWSPYEPATGAVNAQLGLIDVSDNDGSRRILPLLSVR
jgi:hypothetical protein